MSPAKEPESLADFVRRVRHEKGLSLAGVERQSARHGRRITGSYVNRIENGLKKKVSGDRLVSLARGLDVSEAEIYAANEGKPLAKSTAIEERLLTRFRALSADKQEEFFRILDAVQPAPSQATKKKGSRAA